MEALLFSEMAGFSHAKARFQQKKKKQKTQLKPLFKMVLERDLI